MCLYIDAEEHKLGDLDEPASYKAALLDPESDKWLNAMNLKMQSMKDNKVWELVDLPPNGKTVSYKWLFKKKTDMNGAVHTYKAHLVAKSFTQTLGIDYEETFSPVADIRAIRILIAITAFYDYEIWQMDVKAAFLNGYLNEEVYIEQPEGFVSQKFPNRDPFITSLHTIDHEIRTRKEKERVVLERETRERDERKREKIFLDILNNLLFQVEKFLITIKKNALIPSWCGSSNRTSIVMLVQ
ncbi:putative retrotransposon ty1-copia subclass protein [Tanacetum coccineum]|uniref:Retrotransposon ty1-copia subclass protein n=1 Tax=Tanacetum coccineum TaxID=301880 RepID=A0ABQ5C8F3_9ASTR